MPSFLDSFNFTRPGGGVTAPPATSPLLGPTSGGASLGQNYTTSAVGGSGGAIEGLGGRPFSTDQPPLSTVDGGGDGFWETFGDYVATVGPSILDAADIYTNQNKNRVQLGNVTYNNAPARPLQNPGLLALADYARFFSGGGRF